MATVEERARHQLYLSLEASLGHEEADTLMELLPPVGWADVATKGDLESQRVLLSKDIAAVRTDLSKDIEVLRTDLSKDIAAVRTDLSKDIEALRTDLSKDIETAFNKLLWRTVSINTGLMVAWSSVLVTAVGRG